MSILNNIVCAEAGGNTGIADCSLTLKNVLGGFLVPNSFELTAAQLASKESVMAALEDAINNDIPSQRIYPLPQVVGVTDNTEDPVFETLGYGAQVPVRDGKYNFLYRYTRGGNCVSNQLSKFNNGNYRFLGLDAAGILFGTKVGTSLKGIPLDFFYNRPFRFSDGTAGTTFAYQIVYDPVYINSGLAFVQMDVSSVLALSGLQNIVLSLAIPRATNVITVKATTGCAGTDLYDEYSTELAAVGNFKVTEAGKDITITSVAVNANLKALSITLDATDPDYAAGGPFVVSLAPVSVLSAAGVVGFEGIPLTVA